MSKKDQSLAEILKADRVKRVNAKGEIGMSWPEYADFLGVKMTTVYKIAQGVHTPRETTVARIKARLEQNPIRESGSRKRSKAATDTDAEVVQVRE